MGQQREGFRRCMVFISHVVVLSAINMLAGQILGMAIETLDAVDYTLRFYVMALCTLVIFVEMEWTQLARGSIVRRIWVTRGLFYGFIGVLGLEQNEKATLCEGGLRISDLARAYLRAVSWVMIACGILYLILGILCMHMCFKSKKPQNHYSHEPNDRADFLRSTEI